MAYRAWVRNAMQILADFFVCCNFAKSVVLKRDANVSLPIIQLWMNAFIDTYISNLPILPLNSSQCLYSSRLAPGNGKSIDLLILVFSFGPLKPPLPVLLPEELRELLACCCLSSTILLDIRSLERNMKLL